MFFDARFRELGVKRARLAVGWDVMTTRAQVKELDRWMGAARRLGVEPLVSYMHSRTNRRAVPSPLRMQREFRRFRHRYPWATTFATWNEANHCGEPLCHRPKLAAAFYRALRRECPTCTILAPEVLDTPNMRSWVQQFGRELGFMPQLWGLHNYVEANRFKMRRLRELLRVTRGAKIWLTETGGLVRRDNGSQTVIPEGARHAGDVTRYIFDRIVPLQPARQARLHLPLELGVGQGHLGLGAHQPRRQRAQRAVRALPRAALRAAPAGAAIRSAPLPTRDDSPSGPAARVLLGVGSGSPPSRSSRSPPGRGSPTGSTPTGSTRSAPASCSTGKRSTTTSPPPSRRRCTCSAPRRWRSATRRARSARSWRCARRRRRCSCSFAVCRLTQLPSRGARRRAGLPASRRGRCASTPSCCPRRSRRRCCSAAALAAGRRGGALASGVLAAIAVSLQGRVRPPRAGRSCSCADAPSGGARSSRSPAPALLLAARLPARLRRLAAVGERRRRAGADRPRRAATTSRGLWTQAGWNLAPLARCSPRLAWPRRAPRSPTPPLARTPARRLARVAAAARHACSSTAATSPCSSSPSRRCCASPRRGLAVALARAARGAPRAAGARGTRASPPRRVALLAAQIGSLLARARRPEPVHPPVRPPPARPACSPTTRYGAPPPQIRRCPAGHRLSRPPVPRLRRGSRHRRRVSPTSS